MLTQLTKLNTTNAIKATQHVHDRLIDACFQLKYNMQQLVATTSEFMALIFFLQELKDSARLMFMRFGITNVSQTSNRPI